MHKKYLTGCFCLIDLITGCHIFYRLLFSQSLLSLDIIESFLGAHTEAERKKKTKKKVCFYFNPDNADIFLQC